MSEYILPSYIDHTLLKATATSKDITRLCEEAIKYNMAAVCVNPYWVSLAKKLVADYGIRVATVVGFPLGASATRIKVEEAIQAIKDGADEIDVVANVGLLLEEDYESYRLEIQEVKAAIGDHLLKVIIETCYLSDMQICKAAQLAMDAGADFIKTSTGFGSRGASLHDIEVIKDCTALQIPIKAAGGIRDLATALKYLEMGVKRIGTSSGAEICEEWTKSISK